MRRLGGSSMPNAAAEDDGRRVRPTCCAWLTGLPRKVDILLMRLSCCFDLGVFIMPNKHTAMKRACVAPTESESFI